MPKLGRERARAHPARSDAEYYALAKSLDVVGDRWTLLIVGELALRGRYTDLPDIATTWSPTGCASSSMRRSRPRGRAVTIATTLDQLTERGGQLEPVLVDLDPAGAYR